MGLLEAGREAVMVGALKFGNPLMFSVDSHIEETAEQ
jgi:hypothetical protein